jgi:UDP-3-O-[3-hydroxymyristoyl] N-acetylglucosamine deacetylase/3-hydroxyacyl-[acyl-carrier-protein] dehydratase
MTTPRQQTVASAFEIEGVGLHTGAAVHMRCLPASVGTGVVFRRTDLAGRPEIPAHVAHVVGTDRGTILGIADARVQTVEHLLAAIAANRVDNLLVELDAGEPPALDGSAEAFHALIQQVGIEEQDGPAKVLAPDAAFSITEGTTSFVVAPAPDLQLSTTIEFQHPLIGRQFGSFRLTPDEFGRDIAAARTFCMVEELDGMLQRGLARGGTAENALVLETTGLARGAELRFPDEFVRHKTLDLLGDLALVGARLSAHIVAERPGHRANVALARELVSRAEKQALARPILSIQQILQYLPHRYPFLLVDRVVEYEEGKRIVGLKNVTINEPFFVGHFPGHPVMPGVLIIEAMAQVGGLLMMDTIENPEDQIVYFMSLDRVKWRRPVIPGDQIRFELEVLQIRGRTCRMRGVGTVDGQVVAEAEMMARVVDR